MSDIPVETIEVPGTLQGAEADAFAQVLVLEANLAEVKAALTGDGPPLKRRHLAQAGLVGSRAALTDMGKAIEQIK